VRLAKNLQYLKVESYGFAARAIDEIGRLWAVGSKAEHSRMKRP
jgi:hypothetical protein